MPSHLSQGLIGRRKVFSAGKGKAAVRGVVKPRVLWYTLQVIIIFNI
ncbi:hypothetical protein HMPREF0889_0079 [Megasphaera lornae]|uniref:Uncharacterized protein n=1 Tax=Megasphaera lornae TaxID=1000568 RepID=D3LT93_9FIRM|nr:hypothetical protein HMPREF0889_0079 [Megasphaera genomosp. type_1 str. 28L]